MCNMTWQHNLKKKKKNIVFCSMIWALTFDYWPGVLLSLFQRSGEGFGRDGCEDREALRPPHGATKGDMSMVKEVGYLHDVGGQA